MVKIGRKFLNMLATKTTCNVHPIMFLSTTKRRTQKNNLKKTIFNSNLKSSSLKLKRMNSEKLIKIHKVYLTQVKNHKV
jgi:hypothetical protein